MGEFDKYLQEIGIEHYYSYPRTPKTYKYATVYDTSKIPPVGVGSA